MSTGFSFEEMFQLGEDTTEYRLLTEEYISTGSFEGKHIIKVKREGLTLLAEEAFRDVSHLLRKTHLEQTAQIMNDPEASDNDKYVALELIKNAAISAEAYSPCVRIQALP
jgi:fumarate hydratase class I